MSDVRHCHFTNTPNEMKRGLTNHYNFIEGDVRLEGVVRNLPVLDHWREPIMAHDPANVAGMTLDEWLDVGQASGRGLKLDIKQAAAVPKILERVKAHHIPDDWLMFNGDVTQGPGSPGRVTLGAAQLFAHKTMREDDLKEIRRQFPNAMISIGAYTGVAPTGTTYSPKQVASLNKIADEVGGPISFPLRAEFVTPEVVAQMKPHGMVSIWNDPNTWKPADVDAEIRRFREMGVDGIIDLRQASHPSDYPKPHSGYPGAPPPA